jgi:hypothetical protein
MTTTTTAERIFTSCKGMLNETFRAAAAQAVDHEDDWEVQRDLYWFADGSTIAASWDSGLLQLDYPA